MPVADPPGHSSALEDPFQRLRLLFGAQAVQRLRRGHVAVFGLGGVGSFAAEALCRSAVGHLTLIDFDVVCASNINRQLPATTTTLGRFKAEVVAERLRLIHPDTRVEPVCEAYRATEGGLLQSFPCDHLPDIVVDCIDDLPAKAHLLAACKARAVPVVSSMGAACKRDPTRIRVADLADTKVCRLARKLRGLLRQRHGFVTTGAMGIPAVYSEEPSLPDPQADDTPDDEEAPMPSHRRRENGTVVCVTGTFGLTCASQAMDLLMTPPAPAKHSE